MPDSRRVSISALDPVRKLVAVGREELDAIVLEGVVRRRNHDPQIGMQRAGQHGHRGRRHRPDQHHVHAHRDETRGQRRLEQVTRKPGVLADDDPGGDDRRAETAGPRPCRPGAPPRRSWDRRWPCPECRRWPNSVRGHAFPSPGRDNRFSRGPSYHMDNAAKGVIWRLTRMPSRRRGPDGSRRRRAPGSAGPRARHRTAPPRSTRRGGARPAHRRTAVRSCLLREIPTSKAQPSV